MVDLSAELTVFAITVGDERSFAECRAHLDRQDCRFRLEVIDRVAPMEAALQAMLDRCRTPYFVQVDEDMLLDPTTVRSLHQQMSAAPPEVAILARPLWDAHLRTGIIGVKIYRHQLVKGYPYRRSFSCELEQLKRLERDGLRADVEGDFGPRARCAGVHGAMWTERGIFERYRNLILRHRRYENQWPAGLPLEFMRRYEQEPTNENRWAFLGAIAGLVGAIEETEGGDKDFRGYQTAPEWRRLSGALGSGPAELELRLGQPGPGLASRLGEVPRAGLRIATATLSARRPLAALRLHAGRAWRHVRRQLEEQPPARPPAELLAELLDRFPTVRRLRLSAELSPELRACLETAAARGIGCTVVSRAPARIPEDLAGWPLAELQLAWGKRWSPDAAAAVARRLPAATLFTLSATVTRSQLAAIPALLDEAGALGMAAVDLHNLAPVTGVDRRFRREALQGPGDAAAVDRLRRHPRAALVRAWPVLIGEPEACPWRCNSPWTYLGVDGGGRMTGCRQVMAPTHRHPAGEEWPGFTGAWHSPHLVSLRRQLNREPEQQARHVVRRRLAPSVEQCAACFENWTERGDDSTAFRSG